MNDCIGKRLDKLINESQDEVLKRVVGQILEQNGKARISQDWVRRCGDDFNLTAVELALRCLPVAACYASAPVSHFNVGAVAVGQSGAFYFGANQEFSGDAVQQTVHAEQSAVSHAWLAGEVALTDMVVNYTPCGHCRQFMNELNSADRLQIHLPHSRNNRLHSYLPDAFGPKDLNISRVLFDPQPHSFGFTHADPLVQAAADAAEQAYAPYSRALSGVALQVGTQSITGRYAENAAFNPSFLPLQCALNYRRLSGLSDVPVSRIVMAESQGGLSHRSITEQLAHSYLGLEIEYFAL
ncbi:cytidine deaminase [Actinobacillus succinogenes]|uniref:Cytidine deaminase n=1 Tax=Actinobacillus succinogenes (strain ATCC 55618 / DSM 22257 / CCUG 43843 / 130Z) TaxID=339671 RepID=CDD_ACTSZ|nr:cytidine deaminase [Actinobacillus succinogenes]A6VLF5.1 RecName: Full=Cytidine deaminase; AltName: Full=Cytidine aminohydrolase; Short=CDA [Actinobacillus succinogenes 130Z]ABR73802.1 Cytidine deaminase [Actinobacillus succinogenes 130Z]PHI39742.1 cytidine deaminase [Actinobacillus succinogenes]